MFTATLYNNTGFNAFNVPDKPSLLESAASSKKSVPTMDILQLFFNDTIIIRAFEPDVMQADFLKLTREAEGSTPAMDAYYIIKSYNMTSGDTIELYVAMEPFLTAGGVDYIDFLDGTTSRHHTDDNYLNKYTEDDPLLVPTYPIQISGYRNLFVTLTNGANLNLGGMRPYVLVCVTSMPLGWENAQDGDMGIRLNIPNTDYTETDGSGNTVYCTYNKAMSIPTASGGSGGSFAVNSNYGSANSKENVNPIAGQYITIASSPTGVNKIKACLANLAANGMLNLVQSVYYIPRKWVDKDYDPTSGGVVTDWPDDMIQILPLGFLRPIYTVDSLDANFVYKGVERLGTGDDDIHNGRALTGKYNALIYRATASGDSKTYNPEELDFAKSSLEEYINPGDLNNVQFQVRGWSDVRPAGGVKFQVGTAGSMQHYKQGNDYITVFAEYNNDVIKGGTWAKASLAYNAADNYNLNKAVFDAQQQSSDLKADIASMEGISKADAWSHSPIAANNMLFEGLAWAAGTIVDAFTTRGVYASYEDGNGGMDLGSGVVAGDKRLTILANRQAEKSAELAQFNAQNISKPHFVGSAESDYDPDFNSLIVYKMTPHEKDIKKFDRILNQFGYKVSDVMDKSYLTNRQNYNYIETKGVSVKCDTIPKSVRDSLADEFNGGVRIWHVKPDVALYDKYNPIVTNGGN